MAPSLAAGQRALLAAPAASKAPMSGTLRRLAAPKAAHRVLHHRRSRTSSPAPRAASATAAPVIGVPSSSTPIGEEQAFGRDVEVMPAGSVDAALFEADCSGAALLAQLEEASALLGDFLDADAPLPMPAFPDSSSSGMKRTPNGMYTPTVRRRLAAQGGRRACVARACMDASRRWRARRGCALCQIRCPEAAARLAAPLRQRISACAARARSTEIWPAAWTI